MNMGIAVNNLSSFIDVKEGDGETPDTPYGHELAYIRKASKLTNDYLDSIEEAANKGRKSSKKSGSKDFELTLKKELKLV